MLALASRLVALVVMFTVFGAPGAQAGTQATTQATTQARTQHTHRVVVRPVTATGKPAPGWTVHREAGTLDGCSASSGSAVGRGIDVCFPMYLAAFSCWKSTDHTVLCLQRVAGHRIARIRYRGRFHVGAAPRHAVPQELRLYDGQTCTVHVGGAWPPAPGHPRWAGFYRCGRGFVYGPLSGDGINRSRPVWRVREVQHGRYVTHRVRTATYVGNRG